MRIVRIIFLVLGGVILFTFGECVIFLETFRGGSPTLASYTLSAAWFILIVMSTHQQIKNRK
jgi:hypothetical protein